VRVCGVIEGFYGPPWSHAERLDLIRFCGREGLTTWVHAPKDDPYHRARWRDPYPEGDIARLAELVGEAGRAGVEVVYAIAPGQDLSASNEQELEALLAKCEQVRSAGVRSFQLLWDDIEPRPDPHVELTNRVARELDQPGPLVVCPTDYAGTADSSYRRVFRARLDPEVVLYWTGPEVVSSGISREALDLASARFGGHELLLWDNYPVNDFAPELLFLGPLEGRDPRLADGPCVGLIANAMLRAVPSKLALATVADWARDPAAYDPVASFERALSDYGGEVVEALVGLAPGHSSVAERPGDVPALVAALRHGVDAATGLVLLEPFA
jgi:hyaluronoglucosaminidase